MQTLRPGHTERPHYRQHIKRYIDGLMGVQPILPVTLPIKKIKDAAHHQCEQASRFRRTVFSDGDTYVVKEVRQTRGS